jgi:hypothetical protein
MRTYEDNVETINELWQTFMPTHELKQLFREQLSKLNQDVLYLSIKRAKVDNEGPWPAIKWFTTAYADVQRKLREAGEVREVAYKPIKNTLPKVDGDAEAKLVSDFRLAIQDCGDQGFVALHDMIVDRVGRCEIGLANGARLCNELREHVFGPSVGLSRVDKSGDLQSLPVGKNLQESA